MKDFGDWFRQGIVPAPPKPQLPAEPDLYPSDVESPDGVELRVRYFANCRKCNRTYEIPCDPSEVTHEGNLCGAGGPSPCVL